MINASKNKGKISNNPALYLNALRKEQMKPKVRRRKEQRSECSEIKVTKRQWKGSMNLKLLLKDKQNWHIILLHSPRKREDSNKSNQK